MNSSAIRRPLSRWIAAAAAAGLLVGLMGSRILPVGAGRIQPQVPVARSVMPAVPTPAALVSDSLAPAEFEGDELALSEIDQAVHTQRIAALSTLDEMTPTIRPAEMIARSRAIR